MTSYIHPTGLVGVRKKTLEEFFDAATKAVEIQLNKRNLTSINGVVTRTWVQKVLEDSHTRISQKLDVVCPITLATKELHDLRIQHVGKSTTEIFFLRCLRDYHHDYLAT